MSGAATPPAEGEHAPDGDASRTVRTCWAKVRTFLTKNWASTLSILAVAGTCFQAYEAHRGVNAQVGGLDKQYRPWLAVSHFDKPHLDASAHDHMDVTVTNVGTIPAWGTLTAYGSTGAAPLADDPWKTQLLGSEFAIGPNQSRIYEVPMQFLSGVTAKVRGGELVGCVCIRAGYTGPDRSANEHVMRSCYCYTPIADNWAEVPERPFAGEDD